MSAVKNISTEDDVLLPSDTPKENAEISSSGRVDINILLSRVRKEQEKERRTNLVFIGLTLLLIFITGLILSL
tara:strand:- start:297 stop:515 length:219 start_codon:yes stop_codon:yes gene_type:complete